MPSLSSSAANDTAADLVSLAELRGPHRAGASSAAERRPSRGAARRERVELVARRRVHAGVLRRDRHRPRRRAGERQPAAAGVEVPTGRRLQANVASIHRRLSEEGDCPCAACWVKYKGEWVQPTDAIGRRGGVHARPPMSTSACGCIAWVKKEDARRQLRGRAGWRGASSARRNRKLGQAPDEARALRRRGRLRGRGGRGRGEISEEALGFPVASCATWPLAPRHVLARDGEDALPGDVRAVRHVLRGLGGRDRAAAKPGGARPRLLLAQASRTSSARATGRRHEALPRLVRPVRDREYLERHAKLANMYGEMNHRQLKKTC